MFGAGGRAGGFMQLCHGKAAPLRRLSPGDGIVYYSPTEAFRGPSGFSSFTALGDVKGGEPYRIDCGAGFVPHRRDVDWRQAGETPIRPLLDTLELTRGKRNWGYQLRFGLLEIGEADFDRIALAMTAVTPSGSASPPPR